MTAIKPAASRVAANSHAVDPSLVRPIRKPPLNAIHNARVATNLRSTLSGKGMRLAEALAKPTPPAQAPRKGADGDYYAPNGDRLIKVQRGLSFALVNPNTNEVFYPTVGRTGVLSLASGFKGPVKLPEGQRFTKGPFSAAQVAKFESEANSRVLIPRCPPIGFHPTPIKPGALM